MPPDPSHRDWYESGKSKTFDRAYTILSHDPGFSIFTLNHYRARTAMASRLTLCVSARQLQGIGANSRRAGPLSLVVRPFTHMTRRVLLRWAVVLLGVLTALVVMAIATAPRWRALYYGGPAHY